MKAFAIRLEKPLTKDKAVNAAEMEAYGLASAMDVASLNAALARKWRENINDKDVSEHDVFIRWVKAELDKTGLFAGASDNMDETRPTIGDVVALSRIVAGSTEVTDEQALGMKRLYPDWKAGDPVPAGAKRNYNEGLWKCLQAHTAQAGWEPSPATGSLWARIDETHEGTEDDPAPYAPPMRIYNGKYYTQGGKTYKCTMDSGIPLPHNLAELVGLYVEAVADS